MIFHTYTYDAGVATTIHVMMYTSYENIYQQ